MDRDQQFYHDEETDPRETGAPEEKQDPIEAQEGEVDDNSYFLQLLVHLQNQIEMGHHVPLTRWQVVDGDSCLKIIEDLKKNLPEAIQFGEGMKKEQERIMDSANTQAKKFLVNAEMKANKAKQEAHKQIQTMLADAEAEADSIVANAKERADRMVSESEVVRRANDEARKVRNEARVAADEMRLKANHDAYVLISDAEDQLASVTEHLRSLRKDLGEEEEE